MAINFRSEGGRCGRSNLRRSASRDTSPPVYEQSTRPSSNATLESTRIFTASRGMTRQRGASSRQLGLRSGRRPDSSAHRSGRNRVATDGAAALPTRAKARPTPTRNSSRCVFGCSGLAPRKPPRYRAPQRVDNRRADEAFSAIREVPSCVDVRASNRSPCVGGHSPMKSCNRLSVAGALLWD